MTRLALRLYRRACHWWENYERTGGFERDESLMVSVVILVVTATAVFWGCCWRWGQ